MLGVKLSPSIQIRKLQSFYNANSQKFAVISPAYQWAEGLEEVGLISQYSSRLP